MGLDFAAFDAMTFDCYGTIVDWQAGLLEPLRAFTKGHGVKASDADLLAAFAAHEHLEQKAHPEWAYPKILESVLLAIAARFGVRAGREEQHAFGASVGDWPPFPDSRRALELLAGRFRLVVISNVDRASFGRTQQRLGTHFDAVITAEDTGAWKPDPQAFQLAFEQLAPHGIVPERTLHVAQSLFHDHVPAKAMGLKTVHVDRYPNQAQAAPSLPAGAVKPDLVVRSLQELADVVERSFA